MHPRTFIIVAAIALALPAILAGQTIGLRVGVATPQHGGVHPYGGFPGPYQNHPRFGHYPPGGYYPPGAYNPYIGLPPGSYVVPVNPYAPRGAVIVVPPSPGQKVSPGHRRPNPRYDPGYTVVGPGVIVGYGNSRALRPTHPVGPPPSSPVVPPRAGGVFVTGSRNREPAAPLPGGIGLGSTRAEVIAHYGRPTVSISDRNGEALVFGGTTFVIQNGVVAMVNSR